MRDSGTRGCLPLVPKPGLANQTTEFKEAGNPIPHQEPLSDRGCCAKPTHLLALASPAFSFIDIFAAEQSGGGATILFDCVCLQSRAARRAAQLLALAIATLTVCVCD